MCYTQMRHHCVNHLRAWKEYLRIEKRLFTAQKDYYGLKKTINGFEVISAE